MTQRNFYEGNMHRYAQNYTKIKYALAIIIALLMVIAMMLTGSFFEKERLTESDYSAGWHTDSGEPIDPDTVNTTDYNGEILLLNTLPNNINYNDALCFVGYNVKFKVFVDGEAVYMYYPASNLTGNGYGVAYHTVNLRPDLAGKEVKIDLESIFDNERGGRLRMISIENGQNYRNRIAKGQMVPFIVSISIGIIGIILLFLRLVLPYRESQPSLVALGIAAVITGIWFSCDTGFVRLTTEAITFSTIVDHACLHIWVLPLGIFLYSLTKQRKRIFKTLGYVLTFTDIAFFLFARFVLGWDMAFMNLYLILYLALAAILTVVMLISDRRYCKANNLHRNRRFFYIGLIAVIVTATVDILIYISGVRRISGRGVYARLGFVIFFVMMAVDAINAWLDEQTSIRRDRIINKILHFAVSSNDPEVSIRAVLEYFGKEFCADHTYIYENRCDGTFHNTYEWYAEGTVKPSDSGYYDIPYEGLIDSLYEVFEKEHRLVVDYSEATRKLNPILYTLMTGRNIKRMVLGPLECNSELIGLFGADNVIDDRSNEMADIIWLMSYFITQLILQRNEKRDLVRYSYVDSLTGAGNRRAMVEFEVKNTVFRPYGYVMCDIDGLKKTHDTRGHEAGDQLIIDVAHSMLDVFGENNVYRMGGDEFVAYAFTDSKEQFDSMILHLRSLIKAKGRSASIGALYVTDQSLTREQIRDEADRLMYKDKEQYYNGENDRRTG